MTRHAGRNVPKHDDLLVECWCRTEVLYVRAGAVRAGRTESCGMPGCHPPEQAPPTLR